VTWPSSAWSSSAVSAQRDYYARTATTYDGMHDMGEHHDALRHVAMYMQAIGAKSVLDTGCGTGMAMLYLTREMPDLLTHGNDPSEALLRVAQDRHGIPGDRLDCVSSERLPYEDGAFDAVVETGMLHHTPEPQRVVAEMLRVARKAVFISDSNIYGQVGSSLPARALKLALARAGLLRPLLRRMRGGHDWYFNEGDGVAWSYSIFDSYPLVRDACAESVVLPTGSKRGLADACPILFASHCLIAGFKEPLAGVRLDR
jgi:ubiquinone/menaquinone biosynthesis C-methylase UbiE